MLTIIRNKINDTVHIFTLSTTYAILRRQAFPRLYIPSSFVTEVWITF